MQNGLNLDGLTDVAANKTVLSKPLIIDGVVYVGVCDKYFYALSLDKGDVIWSYYSEGMIMTTATMHDDILYFGSGKCVYAISKDGDFLWKFKTGGIILGNPTTHNDVLYFGSGDNYFYAVSLKTKDIIFKIRTGADVISDILVDEDKIYFGSQDYCVYCVDLNGNILWKFRSKGAIMTGSVAVTNEMVFFASADENLYALSKKDGSFIWGFKTGDQVFNNPFILGSNVCIGS
ncbi:MAG: PQQ-like beta-propeller repeat protein, partial [Candidatus Aenigmarchaeota archaeon]|nr:PQQ-like beta-propeller repeat protein [Candidatus Aenigmarchaeota archaeon]